MKPIIKVSNVKKEYESGVNKILAIKNASFEINRGEKISIVGPSGCGKTTLINIMGLLIEPTEGNLYIERKDVFSLSSKERAKIRNKFFGYVFQDFVLVEEDTIFQNIEIPLLYSDKKISKTKRKEKVINILNKLDLPININEKVKNLSGGQRQKVAIARAIINNPEVIFADEPTGSLDVENGRRIFSILEELVYEGKTLVIVTHNESIAKQCDRKFKIYDGHVMIN